MDYLNEYNVFWEEENGQQKEIMFYRYIFYNYFGSRFILSNIFCNFFCQLVLFIIFFCVLLVLIFLIFLTLSWRRGIGDLESRVGGVVYLNLGDGSVGFDGLVCDSYVVNKKLDRIIYRFQ